MKPGVHDQVASIRKKFARRLWVLRHLKKIRIDSRRLVMVYTSLIRSTIEYAAVVYGGLLTQEQSKQIERLQAIALRTIVGWDKTYSQALEITGLRTLAERRQNLTRKFAQKTANNERFADRWFPANHPTEYNLRRRNYYATFHANRDRLRNAPIYLMRRMLNEDYNNDQETFPDLDDI